MNFKLVPPAVVRWEKCGGLLGRQESDGSIQMEDWETWPGTGRGMVVLQPQSRATQEAQVSGWGKPLLWVG